MRGKMLGTGWLGRGRRVVGLSDLLWDRGSRGWELGKAVP